MTSGYLAAERVPERLRTVRVTRYVTPLREGDSLPAIVEAEDDGLYVLKFRGAGQGPKALVAELVVGEIGRTLGLRVPELVLAELDPLLARSEPDPEIQALIATSGGLNLALDYLPGALNFEAGAPPLIAPMLASRILWFDAFAMNMDRTARNPNMLIWHQNLWLIDHGAAFYIHHSDADMRSRATQRFTPIRDHVLLPRASELSAIDEEMAARLTADRLRHILSLVPDGWLVNEGESAEARRADYVETFLARLATPRLWLQEAIDARG